MNNEQANIGVSKTDYRNAEPTDEMARQNYLNQQ